MGEKKKGFTLLELLIAMTILVVILSSTYTLFRAAAGSFSKGETRLELYQQVRIIFEVIERELSSALVIPGQQSYFLGNSTEGVTFFKPEAMSEGLFFISLIREEDEADVREIGYWLSSLDNILYRHEHLNPDYDFSTVDQDEELGVQIKGLSFDYYDGDTWVDTWDSQVEESLPEAVKIEITIEDSKGTKSHTFSSIVRIKAT